jgi:hypothetical protein
VLCLTIVKRLRDNYYVILPNYSFSELRLLHLLLTDHYCLAVSGHDLYSNHKLYDYRANLCIEECFQPNDEAAGSVKLLREEPTKQTPWPLVRKRTMPTERTPLVGEIQCQLLWIDGCRVVSAADPLRSLISVF